MFIFAKSKHKTMKKVALILALLTILASCTKKDHLYPLGDFVQVYKFKDNVNTKNNAYVFLSEDKKKVTSYPTTFSETFPIQLEQGYYLHNEISSNMALLSISRREYKENFSLFNVDTLLTLVAEPDPFQAFYSAVDNQNLFDKDNPNNPNGIDTTYINKLIKEQNLEKEFERYK